MVTWGDTEKKLYRYFRSKGITESGVFGLLGNLYAESGLNPKNLQDSFELKLDHTNDSYTQAVDHGAYNRFVCDGAGYGLAQWTYWKRKQGLYVFLKDSGRSIGSLEGQMEYIYKELSESFKPLLATLKKVKDIRKASDAVLLQYEKPSDMSASMQRIRAGYAQQYSDLMYGEVKTTMSVMISNCGHDENGRYSGGIAGDQTGTEWQIIPYYRRPWYCVLRYDNQTVRGLIAERAKAAALNDLIGYNQANRYSFGNALKMAGDDPAKIKVACDADCSQGVIDIVKSVGRTLGIAALANVNATYTGNMRTGFKVAGFQVLTDAKYTGSADYLLAGDILLNDPSHVATVVSSGARASEGGKITPAKGIKVEIALCGPDKEVSGNYETISELNLRSGAGTMKQLLDVMPKGSKVACYGYYNKDASGTKWLYCVYNGQIGYASSEYLKKV